MTNPTETKVLFSAPEAAGAPIACDLHDAPDTPEERVAEYGRLFAHALIDRERSPQAVELRFAAKAGVAEWVVDLARREAACCPFLSYHVSMHGDRVIWRTSSDAGPAAQAMLDELYSLPDKFGDGLDGLFKRLADRDVHVISDGPSRFIVDDRKRRAGLLGKVKADCGC
jgi:hypothetical protein